MCDCPVILSDDLNEGVRIIPLNWILPNSSGYQLLDKKGKKKDIILWKLHFKSGRCLEQLHTIPGTPSDDKHQKKKANYSLDNKCNSVVDIGCSIQEG